MRTPSWPRPKLQILLLLVLIYGIAKTTAGYTQSLKAQKGILDLRGLDFNETSSVPLRGEWEFYWERFVQPGEFHVLASIHYVDLPSSWNHEIIKGETVGANGFATYRLTLLFDDRVNSMALKLNVISTAYRLYINGEELLTVGVAGETRESTVARYNPSIAFFNASPSTEIILQVSNFDHRLGGARDTIVVGTPAAVVSKRAKSLLNALFLAGCFFMMGIYHLVLYVINRDKSPLLFSLFCFLLTLRLMVTGDIPITSYLDPDWQLLVKMEYLSFYLSGMAFLGFFSSLFRKYRIRLIENFAYIYLGLMSVLVVFTSASFFTRLLISTQIVVLGLVVYSFYILFKEHKQRNREALIFFFGYFFFISSIINDILFVDEFIETGHMFSLGLFVFLGSQAALLSLRFSSAFKTNIVLLEQVNKANLDLESKVMARTRVLNEQKDNLEISNIKITHQNEELQKLNQELDSFVYSVSHDLKAPIASMLGLVHLLEEERDMVRQKKYLQMMRMSLHKQGAFIEDILDYSKNARQDLHKNKIDFERLANRALEHHEFIEDWHRIEKKVSVDQSGEFVSDQQRVSIILNNLLSNALKYSTVANTEPRVEITITTDEQQATIIVTDNGSGIDPAYQDKVFEMFFRADVKKHGSGLGLYIVKETLAKLGGSINLESTVGKGTRLTVVIPNFKAVKEK
jgi:signal transduction histidine kinase